MNVGKFISNYLRGSDISEDTIVTITSVEAEDVMDKTTGLRKPKLAIYLKEVDRAYLPNKTALNALVNMFGDESNDWIGKRFVLYYDPNVSMGSKITGGLRVRLAP